ncbi:molybdenum cofactor synthesis domain-containing protein [Thermodesulfobium acidiphilum]|uniref:Molybdopterin adenylyltransferase n=1 Tax=Thermodesulfobium acidiphilum TaxID=1794699 RepID=A0A2R4W0B1_THEAF|nr:MogA/MoaB family molybdenum cofactor biosynthesis protein [Thermodesulfobium acidiphilum]AWB10251.1 molybdenum cofactor synthesis domain-containing protein [Thermodesulfobium acidiphilum]PMP84607.1 MAG: molybdenum cofactor biosynthesis protein [Thermodesulfobium narugense]
MDKKVTFAVVTLSDSGYKGEREDLSGEKIIEICKERGFLLSCYEILPDEKNLLIEKLIELSNQKINLILTTGGTGFSERDITPEATREVIEKEIPGIPEAMRSLSLKKTNRAMLTRGICGIRMKTIILNLPGSVKAVEECLNFVIDPLEHGIDILMGWDKNCART